jgi:hypothetical protein
MRLSIVRFFVPLLSLLLLAGLLGCDGAGGPRVHYVEGVVTLDGQPVEGVLVNFSPVGTQTAATGTTNAQGVFKLTALPSGTPEMGAEAGEYNVTFMKVAGDSAGSEMTTDDPNYENYGTSSGGGAPTAPKVEHVVPVKYNSPATSGFKVTVKEGRNTGDEFKFDLTR